MRGLLLALLPVPGVAAPVTLDCLFQRSCAGEPCDEVPLPVTVTFDTAAFAPPQSPEDPPRRAIATATFAGTTRMQGEPIWMDGGRVTGFWADAEMLGSAMLVASEDGSARLNRKPEDTNWTGFCRKTIG